MNPQLEKMNQVLQTDLRAIIQRVRQYYTVVLLYLKLYCTYYWPCLVLSEIL